MVRGLWDRQVDTIIDIKICDDDTDTYNYEPMKALLSRWENIKKYKHGKHCNDQRKHFSLFVLLVSFYFNLVKSWHRKGKNPFC